MPLTTAREDNSPTAALRTQILSALEGWQLCRHLARRAKGATQRSLTHLATACHQDARSLAAAYFLLTGVRYWPVDALTSSGTPSLWSGLRRQHQREEDGERVYRRELAHTQNPTLLELYPQMIQGCQTRCRQLRILLEHSGM